MAAAPLGHASLPDEPQLRAFARAAAPLLVERRLEAPGSRAVRRRAGMGLAPLDHREYVPGDEIRHIDWRQTARRLKPIVRRFEAETRSDWILVLDASSSMAVNGAAKWRAATRLAAGMAYLLLGAGHRVGLVTFGARVRAECLPGRGAAHYAALARLLAAHGPPAAGEASALGACVARLRGASSVLVVSDFLADDEMRRDLARLHESCRDLHALQVGDAGELRLAPAKPGDELEDAETGERRAVPLGDAVPDAVRASREALTARLATFCRRRGIAFTAGTAARPWQHVLLEHLAGGKPPC